MERESSGSSSEPRTASIRIGLYPDNRLRVSLHKIETSSISPHGIVQALDGLPSNQRHDIFSLMDASRIMSLDHIAVAANTALIRQSHFESNNSDNDAEEKRGNSRGLALETVICAAGSTNVGSIMKDYAFDAKWEAANISGGQTQEKKFHVLLLSYNVTEEEHMKTTTQVGLSDPETRKNMLEYFSRNRGEKEVSSMMKIYKIGKQEVSKELSSLEKAVLNRVATKFYT